jgi:transposase
MGNPAGVKRNFDVLEKRRMLAARLLKQGIHEAEVARRVGVHRQSVNRWARQLKESGIPGLKKAGRAGRKPKLSESDLRKIEEGLKRGPEALGYETSIWTAWRVADLIERECGVRYTAGHVWLLLRQLGWSCQRPTGRAMERDEDKIRRWKKQRWPAVKKKPESKAAQ